jgi:hypothetical protein
MVGNPLTAPFAQREAAFPLALARLQGADLLLNARLVIGHFAGGGLELLKLLEQRLGQTVELYESRGSVFGHRHG